MRKESRVGTGKYWGCWSTVDRNEEFFLGSCTVDALIRAPVSGLGVHSAITLRDEGWEEKRGEGER